MSGRPDLGGELDGLLATSTGPDSLPGAVTAVVDGDHVVYLGAAGELLAGSGTPMRIDAVHQIASMTKPLTAAAAMQLVERGLLELDAPAGDVCAELAEVPRLVGFEGDSPLTVPTTRPITLRQLLSHSSGFSYEHWDPDIARWHRATGTPGLAAPGSEMLGAPVVFEAGSDTRYSIGVDWAGRMIERVTGDTLGAWMEEHLTGPLGMVDTTFDADRAVDARRAGCYVRVQDRLRSTDNRPERTWHSGGAGLFSTAADYARFLRMLLGGGALDGVRVLSEASVVELVRNQVGNHRVHPMRSVSPVVSRDAEFFPGEPKTWTLGMHRHEVDGATGRRVGTVMWAGIFNTFFWCDPSARLGGVVLTQVLPFFDERALALYRAVEDATYRALRV